MPGNDDANDRVDDDDANNNDGVSDDDAVTQVVVLVEVEELLYIFENYTWSIFRNEDKYGV